jgi:hypothetical protein
MKASVGTSNGRAIHEVAGEACEQMSNSRQHSDHVDMPSWRSSGEFVYLKKVGSRREVVLRRGNSERVLSAAWPSHIFPGSE